MDSIFAFGINKLVLFIGVLSIIWLWLKRNYSYWDRRGFKTLPDFYYFTGHFKLTFRKKSFGDLVTDLYKATDEPIVGMYLMLRPRLLVRDPELIRTILIKDFNHFTDRAFITNEENDPLSGHLFSLPGPKWKNLRPKLSPTFTSGKLKAMFPTLIECGSTLQQYLDKLVDSNELLEVKEIMASYTTNVISSVAFGIDVDSINDPNNEFRVCGRNIFKSSWKDLVKRLLFQSFPKLSIAFGIKFVEADIENFIMSIVKQNVEYREKNNVIRKDFFQLLIQLRNTGTVQLDDEWETVIKSDESEKTMTLHEMAAQVFIFFIAGFETSSSTLSFCLYELAKNRDIQNRAHDEIQKILAQNDGQITYDSLNEMKFLESCIDETLRMYPVLPFLNRVCVQDYQIPGTEKVIEKGTGVLISVYGLQRDEKYYSEPNKFHPDRFYEGNVSGKEQRNHAYLPFGEGPRNCIGMRMGKMQTKVGLVLMLQKYKYELADDLKNRELVFNPNSFLLSIVGGIHLKISKR